MVDPQRLLGPQGMASTTGIKNTATGETRVAGPGNRTASFLYDHIAHNEYTYPTSYLFLSELLWYAFFSGISKLLIEHFLTFIISNLTDLTFY